MIATFGADWAENHADIADILDDGFPGWDGLCGTGRQLSMFPQSAASMHAGE